MIGREVITLILSAAVAAVVVALAVRMLPGAGQLAYGSPMPVFKVAYSNGAVQLWVEDFAGVPYQRAYFYVDGRYVGSEPPGGKITVRCGDRVAALVQYASGVKEVNGTVMCARPARAPGGTPQLFDVYSATMLEAYRAATGDVERTGLPLKITGGIDCNGNGQATFTATAPNVLLCAGWTCGQSLTFGPGTVNMYVYKIPDTVLASQYLGGAHAVFVISVRAFQAGYWSYYLYVNGTLVAYCEQQVESRSGILTQYQIANASGVYLLDLWRPGSDKMFMGNFAIWKKPDGSFGFQIFVNPTDQAPPSDCPYRIPTNFGPVCANLYSSASSKSLFDQFISWVQSNPSAINALSDSLKYIEDASYNVPQIAKNYTYTIDTVHAVSRSYTIDLSLGTLMPASLGAVFANAVLPSDIQAPPVGTPNGTSVPPVSFIASYGG